MINMTFTIGRTTADPLLKYTPGAGTAVTTVTIACDRDFAKDGKKETDFFNIVVWGKQAEATAQHVTKGKLIAVVGRLQTRSYENKDGNKVYVTEIVAEKVQFLEWGEKKEGGKKSGYDDMTANGSDDSIPF